MTAADIQPASAHIKPINFGVGCQAHGAVLVLDANSKQVIAASENIGKFVENVEELNVEHDAASVIGSHLDSLLGSEGINALQPLLYGGREYCMRLCRIGEKKGSITCLTGHKTSDGYVLSLEKDELVPRGSHLPSHQLARKAIDRLRGAPTRDVAWLCNSAAEELRSLSGYDRVIIAKLEQEGLCKIIAESSAVEEESLLHKFFTPPEFPQEWSLGVGGKQHFPLRFIHDSLGKQSLILQDPSHPQPLSIALSPIAGMLKSQAEVLVGNRVRALLLVPIILSGTPSSPVWGMVLCQHFSGPRSLSCATRGALVFLLQALRAHLLTYVKESDRVEERRMAALQTTICDRVTYQVPASLVSETPSIQELVSCDGAAHCDGSVVVTTGACPSDLRIVALVDWARQNKLGVNTLYSTSSLAEAGFPGAASLDNSICGATIATISDTDCLLWFRKKWEKGQAMAWADALACGSPIPPSQPTPPPEQQSIPFTAGEIAAIKGLQNLSREALIGNCGPMKTVMLVRLNEERLRAKQDLAMVARDLERLMESAGTPMMGVGKDYIITGWNQRMAELTVRPKASVLGKGLQEVIFAEHLDHIKQRLEEALSGTAQEHVELIVRCRLRASGGSAGEAEEEEDAKEVGMMVLMVMLTPQLDADQKVVGVSIIGQDVTEQKKMMKEYQDSLYGTFKENIPKTRLPIWGLNRDGKVIEWNGGMAKLTGIPREEALGKSLVGELVGPERTVMVLEKDMLLSLEFALERALAGHETPTLPFDFVNSQGRTVNAVLNIQVLKDDSSGKSQVICFMEDVAMRRVVEKSVTERLAAEAAAEAKTKHLAFLCHEIRNPLNGILGNISFMEDTSLSQEQKELVETTATCGYQLRKIVEDMLDMNQLEAGKVAIEREELHLQQIANAVISQVGLPASKKGLQLSSIIDAKCHDYRPIGDAPRLQQVLSNFAWNSVKFTQTGWVEISIGMEDPVPGPEEGSKTAKYHFRVSDSGEGIPENLRVRLFEQYSTGRKAASSQYGGTGLGLNICQQLASLMGGDIWCKSEVGKGSTFSLEVDLAVLPHTRETKERIQPQVDSDSNSLDDSDLRADGKQVEHNNDADSAETSKVQGYISQQAPSAHPPAPSPREPTAGPEGLTLVTPIPPRTSEAVWEGILQVPSRSDHSPQSPNPMPQSSTSVTDHLGVLSLPPTVASVVPPVLPPPPPNVDPFQAEEAAAATLSQLVGPEWSFRVIKEHLSPSAVAVLAEVSVVGVTRQHWGSVLCLEGQPPTHSLAAATAAALSAAARLYVAGMQPTILPSLSAPNLPNLYVCTSANVPRIYSRAASVPALLPNPSPSPSAPLNGGILFRNPSLKSVSPLNSTTLPPRTEQLESGNSLGSTASDFSNLLSSLQTYGSIMGERPGAVRAAPPPASIFAPKVGPLTSSLASSTPQSPTQAVPPSTLLGMKSLPVSNQNENRTRPTSAPPLAFPERSVTAPTASNSLTGRAPPTFPTESAPKMGPKVLIVDDEPVNVRVVKRVLDRADFKVHTGSDGTDVVERVVKQQERFDALLLDERLKVMNGSEACLCVREYEVEAQLPEMPIIAISANVEPDDLKKYALVGYSAVMGKPINVRVAGDCLKKFLASYKAVSPARRAELRRGEPPVVKKSEDIIIFA